MSPFLTKVNLFKKYDYPSWSIYKYGDMGITIKKDNQVTNWTKYIKEHFKCSLEGTGYTVNLYKRDKGIKGAAVKKRLNWKYKGMKFYADEYQATR